ncbi:MAG: DUF5687 family protein [Bacteroidales bacterium]|nr:DUF5687 family protein [Bacteroidales bacterium]
MYQTLLHHIWLGFRRSHHFERSLGTKTFLAFLGIITMFYMLGLGMMLPGWLRIIFPDLAVMDAFLSLLLLIYAADFVIRFFTQKVPMQQVQPYLHLPVKRQVLIRIILARSWLNIYNFYLFALLLPFFFRTLLITGQPQAFWLLLAGCFLLGSINHTLIMLIKTRSNNSLTFKALLILPVLVLAAAMLLYRDSVFVVSLYVGSNFMQGNPWFFLTAAVIIGMFQSLTAQELGRSMYRFHTHSGTSKTATKSRIETFFQSIPAYGNYWLLEWRLLNRNKRTAKGFRQWPLSIVFVIFFVLYAKEDLLQTYMFFFLMFAGGYGFFHLQFVYSWESRFFDYIAATKIDLYAMIRSKYYFYLTLAVLQTIIITPFLYFIRPELILPLVAFMFYVTGPVFAILFRAGIGYSTRIDPDKKAYFNMEGTSGTQFVFILLVMLSYIPLMVVAYALPLRFETAISLIIGVTGLAGIATHTVWLRGAVKKFNKKKYGQLAKYREK